MNGANFERENLINGRAEVQTKNANEKQIENGQKWNERNINGCEMRHSNVVEL